MSMLPIGLLSRLSWRAVPLVLPLLSLSYESAMNGI